MTDDPYRKFGEPKRGPLTLGEKARSALKGLLRFEPLLEMSRRGMDPDLPRAERVKSAHELGKAGSSEMIFDYLSEESDSVVKEALAYAFEESYRRTMSWYENSLCSIYTAVGSETVQQERDNYSVQARRMANSLLKGVPNIPENGRRALEKVLEHE